RDHLVGSMRPALLATLGAMAVILLIACVNVAALMLGQVDSRGTELAVRGALGAGRRRLLQQLVVESLVVGALAGIVGALLGVAGFRFLVAALPLGELAETATVQWSLFGTAMLVALLAATAVAIAPGASVARSDLQGQLTRARTAGVGGRGGRLESGLVVAQVALVLLMVSGAALLIRSVDNLRGIEIGVETEGVAVVDVVIPTTTTGSEQAVMTRELVEAVSGIAGVESAAATERLPLRGSSNNWGIRVEDRPDLESTTTAFRPVTPGYFETMGIRVLAGRGLEEIDRNADAEEGSVVINQAVADRYFPGVDPLGRRIGFMNRWDRIVGVVENVAESDLSPEPVPARYYTFEQVPWLLPSKTLVLRAQGGRDPGALLAAVRPAIHAVVPSVAIRETTTMSNVLDRAVGPALQVMTLLAILGTLALTLGVVGVYGVVSHFVTRRKRDWGIRIALGMRPRRVIRQIVGRGGALVGGGVVVGLLAFFALARLLASFLYGIEPADAASLVAATAILLAAGLLAAFIPARRASRIDPANVLREQ
ncbi:MAG: FtsX-like permease family protein, partial [Gemmatimonadetes bacterium]|nr:FtsX-like permease family protein [Gemmatimonadota bacterium]